MRQNPQSIRPPEPTPAPTGATAAVSDALASLQKEIDSLHDEVSSLRQRDETLKYYMHRLDEEMRLAARLQRDFLPKYLPQIGPVHFQTLFRPAGYVSGDLYDVMRLDETHVGFYIADAVGHGMPAALLTMFMKNALVTKQITADGYHLLAPGKTMARLNESLVSQNLSYATFATAIYGVIDTQSLRVTFARGGHPNPIVLRADGGMQCLQTDGSLLGIFPDELFPEATVQLAPGDRLFLFTDGVEVAFSDDPEQADSARWREELWLRRTLTTEQLLADLTTQLDRVTGSITPKDDLTMIVIDVK
jgi:sigma-B regulation protein RsbU (phosphoserine phosphatase)